MKNLGKIKWGSDGDIPVPGDYSGDGSTDIAVFKPSERIWSIRGNSKAIVLGEKDDIPVPGDYDGDGRVDVAVYDPETGIWDVRKQFKIKHGEKGDIPLVRGK